jgi:hypothetical protein
MEITTRGYAAITSESEDIPGDDPRDVLYQYMAFGWNLTEEQAIDFMKGQPGERFHVFVRGSRDDVDD